MIVSIKVGPTAGNTDFRILIGTGSKGDPLLTIAKALAKGSGSRGGKAVRWSSPLPTLISPGGAAGGSVKKELLIFEILS